MQTACTSERMCFGCTGSVCSPLIIPIPSECILLDPFFCCCLGRQETFVTCLLCLLKLGKKDYSLSLRLCKAWGIEGACWTIVSGGDVAPFGTWPCVSAERHRLVLGRDDVWEAGQVMPSCVALGICQKWIVEKGDNMLFTQRITNIEGAKQRWTELSQC